MHISLLANTLKTLWFPGQFPGSDFESHQPYGEPHRESRTFTRWAWVNTHKQTHSRCVVRCCLSSMCVISLNWPQGSTAAPHQNISTNCQGLISGKNGLLYLSYITFILMPSMAFKYSMFMILYILCCSVSFSVNQFKIQNNNSCALFRLIHQLWLIHYKESHKSIDLFMFHFLHLCI